MKHALALPFNIARKAAETARIAEEAGWDGLFLGDAIWCPDPMIALSAAAMVTSRIRLGTMVIPMPLRLPWKVASESAALDNLCDGRLILGLGTGATWMGWQSFPDAVTGTRARAEMLDESIDILTQLYLGEPFDYEGKHYHIKLTQLDKMHYPPKPVQQPRIPLWIPCVWPRMKSMRRVLKCDGLLAAKMNTEGKFEEVQPPDLVEMKAFVEANRPATDRTFDYVIEGKTMSMSDQQISDRLCPWAEAGATWWVNSLWGESEADIMAFVRRGPPTL